LARLIAKHTYFQYFCGGENLVDTKTVIEKLYSKNLCTILDYCVEGAPSLATDGNNASSSSQQQQQQMMQQQMMMMNGGSSKMSSQHPMMMMMNQGGGGGGMDAMMMAMGTLVNEKREVEIAQVKSNSITYMGFENHRLMEKYSDRNNGSEGGVLPCPLGVVKMTGISDSNLLLKLSEILSFVSQFPESEHTRNLLDLHFDIFSGGRNSYNLDFNEVMQEYALGLKRTNAFVMQHDQPPSELSDDELDKLRRVIDRLEDICDECERTNIALLVDAEQTYLQPAIDLLSMYVTLKYNVHQEGKRPIVHNTYQLYLKDTLERLKFDHAFIKKHGEGSIKQGAKLVRGAYIKSESTRCADLGLPHPFNNGIEETHKNYHKGIDFVLENMAKDDSVAVVIASHNPDSVVYASNALNEWGLDRNDSRVLFAQLYGMGDSLSLALASNQYNVAKLVPFGPVDEVLPYLSRRLIENSDMLGGSAIETARMKREIAARLFGRK